MFDEPAEPERPNGPLYDRVIAVDWSARSTPSPIKPTEDAIFVCDTPAGQPQVTTYHRTRQAAVDYIEGLLTKAVLVGDRVLLGFDFAFGYPTGFAKALMGVPTAQAVWACLGDLIQDGPDNTNNRFNVAADINAQFPGVGPFWGRPPALNLDPLPAKGTARTGHGMIERRLVEQVVPSAHSVWKLFTTGSVGSQVLMGLPYLLRLKERFGPQLRIWPMDGPTMTQPHPITVVEIYPSLYRMQYLTHPMRTDPIYRIKDALQVKMTCDVAMAMRENGNPLVVPDGFDPAIVREEGWIFGAAPAKDSHV